VFAWKSTQLLAQQEDKRLKNTQRGGGIVMHSLKLAGAGVIGIMCSTQVLANDETPRLHPTEAACISYETSGPMISGTMTRCHRDYAYEQYEIQNTEIGIAGMTQQQNQHTITIGEWIYAINLQTNTGTKTANPMYAGLVSALEGSSTEEMSAMFMSAMGMTATGAVKTVADTNCNVYTSAQLGSVCMTDGGLMLEQDFMGTTQTAVSVSIGDGGDNANYTLYKSVPISDGPDLSNGLQGLMDQFGQ
jgi:hypothetical protein